MILLILMWVNTLLAAEISVSPNYFEFSKPSGDAISEEVIIYNSNAAPMKVTLSVGDFWYDKSGKRIFPAPGSSPFSAAPWVSLPKKEVEVAPKSQLTVPFVFSIPAAAPASSYATLFVERSGDTKGSASGEGSVGLSLRIAVPLLYSRPKEDFSKLRLSHFKYTRPTSFKPLMVRFDLMNEDESYFFPEGTLTIVRKDTKEFIAKDEIKKERIILPKQRQTYEIPISTPLPKGKFEGLLSVFYGSEKHLLQQFEFSVP